MGTWGAGNFADDSALDWLAGKLQAPIEEMITRELSDHDECNGAEIMAAVEVLALVCEHTPAIPPQPAEVAKWRDTYLATWNDYIDELDPVPGYKAARLQVIEATFDRLAAIAQRRNTSS